MEMHQVRYFLAVTRELNFTRAAEECHVAQPSLTRAIKQLEEELGGDLFRRERNLTHLTEFGNRMLPFLQQCFDSAISAKQLASSLKSGAVQPLSIGLSTAVNVIIVMSFIVELMKAFPGIELRLLRGGPAEIGEHLKKGDVEVAIAGPLGEDWGRLDAWPLFTEKMLLAVSAESPLASKSEIEPGALAKERIIWRSHCEVAGEFDNLLKERQIHPGAGHRIATDQDLLALLEANLGVGLVPHSFAKTSKVKTLPLAGADLTRTISCYAVSGRQRSQAAATLIKMVRAADWPMILA